MQTNEVTPSSLERRIEMSVSLAEIEKDVEARIKRLARTVKMSGFRPGKVPLKIVEQTYGAQARSDAMGAALERLFGEKVREQNLRVAGYPQIQPKETSTEGQMDFSAVFEVYPEVVVGDLSSKEIERPVLDITDVDVDRTLDVLRKQRAVFKAVDRVSQKEDRVTVDFSGTLDGEVFEGGVASDFPILAGGGQMLPEFDAQLIGVKTGETKSFPLTFPAEYHAKNLAGQTVQFEIVVKSVEEPQLPKVDAKFAKALGVVDGDVAKMRAEIKSNLEREVKRRIQARVRDQVLDVLIDTATFDIPKSLVETESQNMAESMKQEFAARGGKTGQIPEVQASWFTDQAARRVKLGLIVSELVSTNNLRPQPEQVRTLVEDMAQSYEQPQEVVRWYYAKPENLRSIEDMVVESNVVEWVMGKAKTNDKTVTFEELMGTGAQVAA